MWAGVVVVGSPEPGHKPIAGSALAPLTIGPIGVALLIKVFA